MCFSLFPQTIRDAPAEALRVGALAPIGGAAGLWVPRPPLLSSINQASLHVTPDEGAEPEVLGGIGSSNPGLWPKREFLVINLAKT